jgi:hypothetical protein
MSIPLESRHSSVLLRPDDPQVVSLIPKILRGIARDGGESPSIELPEKQRRLACARFRTKVGVSVQRGSLIQTLVEDRENARLVNTLPYQAGGKFRFVGVGDSGKIHWQSTLVCKG